ncbi:NUDIX domain-containing protein [Notoacmeibacter sp. MSK16QG-6]|uniref:NUDIX domain-containing protein n=1 Tax=Notoacmeibacter sp. MSK16QG-6 TaxID=2957982 RepID=UPI0020A0480C|nr:NUDIX hydrolase [Notoacmeibacter sp. MSK16QG-6]MCP1198755.1 NUDIX hydrolase [Notoacmeibacter sp. MSK16QG-6]
MSGNVPGADRPARTTIAEEIVLHEGYRILTRFRNSHAEPDGSQSSEETRDLLMAGRVVGVIAHDPTSDELVLIRQYRLAAHLQTGKGDLVELVAGGVEDGEDAETSASRELKEETGLEAKRIVHLFDIMPTPGICTELAHFYYAEVDASKLPERAGEDDNEATFPFALFTDEAIALIDSGGCVNGFLNLGLHWFARARAEGRLPQS